MKLNYSRKQLLHEARNLLLVILGAAILGFGTGVFFIPFDLVTGGVSGLAIVIEHLLPFNISVDVYVAVITWSLFFVGLFTLGKNFALKTLVSSIVYPTALALSSQLVSPEVLGGFFYLEGYAYKDITILLAAIFGALCIGVGCAITFVGGGSTGGVDVIAFLICKVFKRLKSSVVLFAVDATIVVLGMFVLKDLVLSLLGIMAAFIFALVVDYVFIGSGKDFVAHIISDHPEEISRLVIERIDRTTTILDAVGGYSKEKKKLVMVSFTINQYSELMNIINRVDKKAFVTISRAHEINGEGWTHEKKS
jgi:uncharacterized membrane-anchored protein YitT (DUF2179 family)